MAREYAKWGEWDKIGFKKNKKIDKNGEKKKNQKEQFARCKVCGGQMTYLKGTNILVCSNTIEKKTTLVDKNGKECESITTVSCSNINMVSEPYQSYMRYLFED
jgi:ssDNA-binding Zn-finger/Zn-ribbon topoisomerase 1